MTDILVSIYILQLQQNKYYVGKTSNPSNRLNTHFDNNGSEWTKMYKPIGIDNIIQNCDPYDEDKHTLKYMKKYGIENVRGGSFSQITLSDEQISTINKMINNADDKCYNCNQKGHFIKDCTKVNNNDNFSNIIYDILKTININNINSVIDEYNKIYEEIILLNKYILITNNIECSDMEQIKKESNINDEIQYLLNDNINIDNNLKKVVKTGNYMEVIKKYNKKRSDNISKICLFQEQFFKRSEIIEIYKKKNNFLNNNNIIIEENKSLEIMALEIINFNLEQKNKLKKIYELYHNEDFVKYVLIRLYEARINMYSK